MNDGPLYSPAAHRASDAVRLHMVAGQAGKWAAIRLSDGGSDGIAYDTRADAIRHQLHETQCTYVLIPWDDFNPRTAELLLRHFRELYGQGVPLADPNYQPLMRG